MAKTFNCDTYTNKKTTRKIDSSNGALYIDVLTARVGLYEYPSGSLEKTPEELFSKKSLDSYGNKSVIWGGHGKTLQDGFVNSENYAKENVCGHVLSAEQDGDFVKARICIKDKAVIDYLKDHEVHASPGYYHDVVDNKQTDITINHLAIFSPNAATARGGEGCRALDTTQKEQNMPKEDKANDAQSRIETLLDKQKTTDNELQKANDAISSKDAEIEALKKENAEMKHQIVVIETNALKQSCDGYVKDVKSLDSCNTADEVKIAVLTENNFMDNKIDFKSVDSLELNAYYNCFTSTFNKQVSNDNIENVNKMLGSTDTVEKKLSPVQEAWKQVSKNKGGQ